jgi:hypothetical protein
LTAGEKTTTKKKKKSSGLTPPSGYSKYIWGVSFEGSKVYIAKKGSSFKGYVSGKWVTLNQSIMEEGDGHFEIFYTGDENLYYERMKD